MLITSPCNNLMLPKVDTVHVHFYFQITRYSIMIIIEILVSILTNMTTSKYTTTVHIARIFTKSPRSPDFS
mgnify:CR=1 FL=1